MSPVSRRSSPYFCSQNDSTSRHWFWVGGDPFLWDCKTESSVSHPLVPFLNRRWRTLWLVNQYSRDFVNEIDTALREIEAMDKDLECSIYEFRWDHGRKWEGEGEEKMAGIRITLSRFAWGRCYKKPPIQSKLIAAFTWVRTRESRENRGCGSKGCRVRMLSELEGMKLWRTRIGKNGPLTLLRAFSLEGLMSCCCELQLLS